MNEYISKEKAIEAVIAEFSEFFDYPSDQKRAVDAINTIEPADVAPVVHGRWIYGEDESGQDGYSCSECDFFVPWYYKYYEQGLHFIKDYHLCPHCGAKMDESEETVGIDLANGSDFTSEGNAKTVNKTEGRVWEP